MQAGIGRFKQVIRPPLNAVQCYRVIGPGLRVRPGLRPALGFARFHVAPRSACIKGIITKDSLFAVLGACQNWAMPFLSGPRHRERYAPAPTLKQQLADIRMVLDALRQLPIATPLKSDMLDAALWQVAFATGNKGT